MFRPITVYTKVTGAKSVSKTTPERIELDRGVVEICGGEIVAELDTEVLIVRERGGGVYKVSGIKLQECKREVKEIILMQSDVYERLEQEYRSLETIVEEIELKGVGCLIQELEGGSCKTIIVAEIEKECGVIE